MMGERRKLVVAELDTGYGTRGWLSASRSRRCTARGTPCCGLNANFLACGDTVLAQLGQAAYWGAIARVSRPL